MPNQHRQHADMRDYPRRGTEVFAGIALAIFIGSGLAVLLVHALSA